MTALLDCAISVTTEVEAARPGVHARTCGEGTRYSPSRRAHFSRLMPGCRLVVLSPRFDPLLIAPKLFASRQCLLTTVSKDSVSLEMNIHSLVTVRIVVPGHHAVFYKQSTSLSTDLISFLQVDTCSAVSRFQPRCFEPSLEALKRL